MSHPEFFVPFDECKNKSLAEFATLLKQLPKKPIGSVTISELCSVADYPNGIYFFFDDDDLLWYVGKATSRSFIERIPAHFDQRHDVWFNTIPKKIMKICEIDGYADAHRLGLKLRIVLLGMNNRKATGKLENALRSFLQPKLNSKKAKNISGEIFLSSFEG